MPRCSGGGGPMLVDWRRIMRAIIVVEALGSALLRFPKPNLPFGASGASDAAASDPMSGGGLLAHTPMAPTTFGARNLRRMWR